MRCIIHPNATAFRTTCETFLLRDESEHNLILGGLDGPEQNNPEKSHSVLISIVREEAVAGAAILHPTERSMLSKMDAACCRALVAFILEQGIPLHSVIGPIESSECFAESWKRSTGATPELLLHTGVYELTKILFPNADGRNLISIDAVDPALAFLYLLGFLADCFPNMVDPQQIARTILDRHAKSQTLFFWQGPEDTAPVSMAAKSRESRNGATISLVYTPPQLRRQGHASRMVAALSDRCLKEGKKFCNLFADVRNPTSNAIYQEIGYRKIGESKHFSLGNRLPS